MSLSGESVQVRLVLSRATLEEIDDLSELLQIPRPSVLRAVVSLGVHEFTHRWSLVYYNLHDLLRERKTARTPHANPAPLDEELERVSNPAGPEIQALTGKPRL